MRASVIAVFALTAVYAGLGAFTSAGAEPPARFDGRPTVTFAYETRANPPRYMGEGTEINWNRPGLTLELLKTVGERLQINLEFRRLPWKRGLFLVETDEIDGIFHASYKAAREAIGVYPKTADGAVDEGRAVFFQSYSLHVLRGSPVTWDGKTIGGLGDAAVGATAGYSIVSDLENNGVKVETGKVQEINLNKLVAGRIAAYAELDNMAAAAIRGNQGAYADVIRLEPPLRTKAYFLLLSKGFVAANPDLAEAIWTTIAEINADPTFQARVEFYASGP